MHDDYQNQVNKSVLRKIVVYNVHADNGVAA
jgi:hypothetical protein